MRSKTTLSIAAAGFFACMVFLVFSATFKTEPAPAQVPEVTIRAGGAPDERDIDLLVGDTGTQAPGTLRVSNGCGFPIWVAQQNLPGAVPLTYLTEDSHVDFAIPAAGAPSTRFWAKAECDDAGQACQIGQSQAPCPAGGCAPPVDSKLEASFACLLSDAGGCAVNPSSPDGGRLDSILWWNASLVDGFTLPFAVRVSGVETGAEDESGPPHGRSVHCEPADCSQLKMSECPTDDDLSDDGKNPLYVHQDERTTGGAGCFAPYMKLGYPGHGGDGLNAPAGPVEKMYACPTPPVSPDACRGGPVTKTKYVKLVRRACKETVYSYAYDDALGLRACPGQALLELAYCPEEAR